MEINNNTSYMIGLFQTDGSLSKGKGNKGKFQLEISSKDKDIIFKLKDIIPYYSGIRTRTRYTKIKKYEYNCDYISLSVCRLEFRNFLFESGVPYGKKSKIIKPPLYLEKLSIKDYVRGLYDGDGSLGMTKENIPYISFTTDSDDIAYFLVEYISKITNKPIKNIKRNKRDNIYNIVITKEDAIELCNEIYYDGCISLDRKFQKSLDVKNWKRPNNMKHNDNRKIWTKYQDEYILNHEIDESMDYLNRTEESVKMRLWRLNKKEGII